ncbi:MAG: aldolase/citrate lyase family protein [Rhodobacteraceae bacterium]|nr:aldolase/citrate lyase family protein [Paracoccaceae bacterium]
MSILPGPGLKAKLAARDRCLTTAVCTIPSAVVTQALAASGLDCVMVDLEHGAVDYASAHAMIAATQGSGCAPLVRVAENDTAQVKRALDLGAEGIVFPLIRSASDAARAVASLRYPPRGDRGFGPFIAQSRWGSNMARYRDDIEDSLVCCLLIETAEAVACIEEICATEGIDFLVLAGFDLSTSLGVSGQFEAPAFLDAVARIEAAARDADLPLGGVALDETQARALRARGYRMIGGFDALWLRQSASALKLWAET